MFPPLNATEASAAQAAYHCLKSYVYGNGSPALAVATAEFIERKVRPHSKHDNARHMLMKAADNLYTLAREPLPIENTTEINLFAAEVRGLYERD